ncbi:MAG: iron-containing alcohol dehydrogenase, partial [Candidatus Thermoplasmatota archaeon]
LSYGRVADWATHGIEHAVSAMYDVTHGVGLAILTPFWMAYVLDDENKDVFVKYAENVWSIKGGSHGRLAEKGIEETRLFFNSLDMPSRLREVGVKKDDLGRLSDIAVRSGSLGKLKKLSRDDVYRILEESF